MNTVRRFSQNKWIQSSIVIGLALLIAGLVNFLQNPGDDSVEAIGDLDVDPAPGSIAPDFTLTSVDGELISLRQFRGKPVLVNFWATWCGPCQIEMPAIQSRFEQFKEDGLIVLAVDFDESAESVGAFRDEFALTFELLLDPGGTVQKLYRNRSYPASFFIDPQGVIQVQHIGVMTEGQLDSYLEQVGLST